MRFILSALRRPVRDDDVVSMHADAVLLLLFQRRAFLGRPVYVDLTELAVACCISAGALDHVIGTLMTRSQVAYGQPGSVGITDEGADFVAGTPWMLRRLGAFEEDPD